MPRPVGAVVAVAVICAVLTLAVDSGVAVGAELDDGIADAARSFAVDDACLPLVRGVSPDTGPLHVDDACGGGGGCERPDTTCRSCKAKFIRLGAQPKVSGTVTNSISKSILTLSLSPCRAHALFAAQLRVIIDLEME